MNHGKDKEHNEEYKKQKKQLLWDLKRSILNNEYDEIPTEFKQWFEKHKANIIPDKFTKSIAYDCHVNPCKYIKYSFYMNEQYELENEKTRKALEQKKQEIDMKKVDKYDTLTKDIAKLKKTIISIDKHDKSYTHVLCRYINIFANRHMDSLDLIHDHKYYTDKKILIKKLKEAIMNNKIRSIPNEFKQWFKTIKSTVIPSKVKGSITDDYSKNKSKYDEYVQNMISKLEGINDVINQNISDKQKQLDATKNKTKIKKCSQEIKEMNTKIIKLFQPLSLRKSCIPRYVTIDTATLINLFSAKGQKGVLLQSLKENQKMAWNKYIKLNKRIFRQTKGYVFNHTIQTDGIGCSLLFCKPELADKKYGSKVKAVKNDFHYIDDLSNEQIEALKNKRLITIDPGKYNLVYMCDDNNTKLRYTCSQRDTESLAKRNRRIIYTNKVNKKIIELETKLSDYCGKTVNYDKFKEYIKAKNEINNQVKSFYEEALYRKLNWRTKTYRQKSEDKFVNRIEETYGKPLKKLSSTNPNSGKNKCVIIYGDWSRRSQMAGLTPTMNIGLRRIIAKKFITLSINEFNTSKKCCNCWKDIEYTEINGNKKFRLLVCKNCNGKNTDSSESGKQSVFSSSNSFLTRDMNSCVNMMSIAKHMINNNKERPKEFCIEVKKEAKKKKVVKKKVKIKQNKKLPSPVKGKGGKSVVFA
jgi:hypothetical protein